MTKYAIVPDGLSAFGVEITWPNRFQSVRGFASVAEARAWIVEENEAEARRVASSAGKVRPASELIFHNHELLLQAECARYRSHQLCGLSLPCCVITATEEIELIRRNRALLAQAAALRSRTREILVTAEMAIQGAQRALIASELRQMNKERPGALGGAKVGTASGKRHAMA